MVIGGKALEIRPLKGQWIEEKPEWFSRSAYEKPEPPTDKALLQLTQAEGGWVVAPEDPSSMVRVVVGKCPRKEVEGRLKSGDYWVISWADLGEYISSTYSQTMVTITPKGVMEAYECWGDQYELSGSVDFKEEFAKYGEGPLQRLEALWIPDFPAEMGKMYLELLNDKISDPYLTDTDRAGTDYKFITGNIESLEKLANATLHLVPELYTPGYTKATLVCRSKMPGEEHMIYELILTTNANEAIEKDLSAYPNIKELIDLIEHENMMEGGHYEYNDGAHSRKSGYYLLREDMEKELPVAEAYLGMADAQKLLKDWLRSKLPPQKIAKLLSCPTWEAQRPTNPADAPDTTTRDMEVDIELS